jgi:hypothetical protein
MAIVLGGCMCTQIGCANQVHFELGADLVADMQYRIELCVASACDSAQLTAGHPPDETVADGDLYLDVERDRIGTTLPDGDVSGTLQLSLRVVDGDGNVLADHVDVGEFFTSSQPNGPVCEPTCWNASVEVPVPQFP